MAAGAPGTNNLNSSFANASRALSSKVSSQGYAIRAEAQSERQVTVRQNNQMDPSFLARMALEDELRKRGGGGGGSIKSYNPMTWIPYSFSLLAKAIEQARAAIANLINQSLNALGTSITTSIQNTFNFLTKPLIPINNFFRSITLNITRTMIQGLRDFAKNPIAFSMKMANNAMQGAMAIFAAVVNGLKKIIYGKDEAVAEADPEEYKEEGLLTKLLGYFKKQDEDRESNGKNLGSHIKNKAKLKIKKRTVLKSNA